MSYPLRGALTSASVALLAALSLAAGPAAASKITNVKSTVTITSGEGTMFTGKVSSTKSKCRAGRTVKLYLTGGPPGRSGDTVVGTATTDTGGAWMMPGSFASGEYYAWVSSVVVHQGGAGFRCSSSWSVTAHY